MFAIVLSARVLASHLPTQLVFDTAEARLVALPAAQRCTYFRHNSVIAIPLALLGAALVLTVVTFAPSGVDSTVAIQLTATAAIVALLFPLQTHGRRLLHLSRRHWAAAGVSMIRLLGASMVLAVGLAGEFPPGVIPFGSLAVGDLAALGFVAVVVRARPNAPAPYRLRQLVEAGRWLLIAAVLGPGSALIVTLLVGWIAGVDVVGVAEAARIAAQPVLVVAAGLAAVARPGALEAAWAHDEEAARALSRRYMWGLIAFGVVYLSLFYLPEAINPFSLLIPKSLEVEGLVAVSVLSAILAGFTLLQRSELIALSATRRLSGVDAVGAVVRSAIGLGAGFLTWWSVPVGFGVAGGIRWLGYDRALVRLYRSSEGVAADRIDR